MTHEKAALGMDLHEEIQTERTNIQGEKQPSAANKSDFSETIITEHSDTYRFMSRDSIIDEKLKAEFLVFLLKCKEIMNSR